MKFERGRIHFFGDVFAAVAVVVAQTPYWHRDGGAGEDVRGLQPPLPRFFTRKVVCFRDGPLENLWGGGRSTKEKFAQGKI